ncbi:dTDP-4-dehydrorhamnose 3,5-epimerase family protein [Candidatus Uabimicrobium sp. HlEnr_7]|uniref:dTDP-4-dehydrorhamnose 3,5-epimerase family protein n=1 Tax=Candidatus Uabimicrobium helgolandensis TaxID=3095367 RepID=UPI0035584AF8
MEQKSTTINGVYEFKLKMHYDSRGWLSEVFRQEWDVPCPPIQWNTVFSKKNTLRGVHTHLDHYDYLVVPFGKMLLGLKDLRINSPTFEVSNIVTLSPQNLSAWLIPPGVAHGFFFPQDSIHFYGLSGYWNLEMDFACKWNDPDLGLDWPTSNPTLSKRDQQAKTLQQVREQLRQLQPKEY